jgi:TfoX/Sxy family transcriptional regulator of competence genes
MGSRREIVDFIAGQMAEAGVVASRKMFGEYAIYCDTKVIAFVCDDQLFVKPTQAGLVFYPEVEYGDPYPGSKPWFLIPEDLWDDALWLSQLAKITADALPLPKPKKKKEPSGA